MPAQIHYFTLQDETPRKEKLDWFRNNKLSDLEMERIHPDEKGNWLNITDNDFEDLLPLASKEVKGNKAGVEFDKAVFKLNANGIKTNRDEWVYDFDRENLIKKIEYFSEKYEKQMKSGLLGNDDLDYSIKWSRDLKNKLAVNRKFTFAKNKIKNSIWRPFTTKYFYSEKILNDVLTENHFDIFGKNLDLENQIISISGLSAAKPFQVLVTKSISDYEHIEKSINLPLYRYDETGNRIENITDWGLEQFRQHYTTHGMTSSHAMSLSKEAIFHYVYAVLHNPAYRKKYEQNLKRDFPRIPFYDDFDQWAAWGKALMELHINYEAPLPPEGELMKVIETKIPPLGVRGLRVKLKADKETGIIEIDEQTTLTGIPTEAWAYKLGNRSALEWILDQYKESKPTDPTILEKFNHYRFADYKEEVIVLLQKVCTVSVETMKIIRAMETSVK